MGLDYSFNLFEVIITYAIDKTYGEEKNESLVKELCITKKVFFKKMYLNRLIEKEIFKHLESSYQPLIVHGFPGTGKTSVVQKVINDFLSSGKNIFILFDFKGLESITSYSLNFDIREWHRKKLRGKLLNILSDIDDIQIVLFFFEDRVKEYELSDDFEEIRRSLLNDFRTLNEECSFLDWLHNGINEKMTDVLKSIKKMIKHLRNRDYLYFIVNKEPGYKVQIVIFYDNLDSITSNEVRKDFYKFIRDYSGVVSHFAHIVICSRTTSIADQDSPDYGTYYWKKINIDYQEFINQDLFNQRVESYIENKGFCTPLDQKFIKSSLERSAKENFAKQIIEKRTKFLETILSGKSITKPIDDEKILLIKEIYNLIITNTHLHGALLELSNHDRHFMFRNLVTFIKYITDELNLKLDYFGDEFAERSFILESYFYHWTIDYDKIECTNYDLVRDTNSWHIDPSGLGCSFSHLIIAAIYNLTDSERGVHNYLANARIKEVISKVSELGYSEDDIKNKIFDLYKRDNKYLGLIELSKFFNVISADNIDNNYSIWLTPRSAYICEYLSHKFLFMISLYRYDKVKDEKQKIFRYADNNPISLKNIKFDLWFLTKIAIMHYFALIKIKELLKDKINWINYYKRWFCITTHDGYENRSGELQLNNILRSHILFLRHQSTIPRYNYITSAMISEYDKLANSYKKAVNDLENDIVIDDVYQYFNQSVDLKVFDTKTEENYESKSKEF